MTTTQLPQKQALTAAAWTLPTLTRSYVQQWRRRRYPRPGKAVLSLGLLAIAVAGVYGVNRWLIGAFAGADPGAAEVVLPSLFPLVTMLILLRGLAASAQRLYLANDLEFLLTTPTPLRTIFWLKVGESSMAASFWALIVQLPVLAAYGHVVGAPLSFYAASLVLTALMVVAGTLPSMIIVMILARLLPRRVLVATLAILGPLQGFVIFLHLTGGGRGFGNGGAVGVIGRRTRLLPTRYLADALSGLQHGRWLPLLATLTVIGIAAALLALVAYRLFAATLQPTANLLREAPRRRMRVRTSLTERMLAPLPGQARVIVLKDWRAWTRDLRQVALQMVPLSIVGISAVYAIRIANQTRATEDAAAAFLSGLQVVPFGLFVMAQPALGSFYREGRSFELLRVAPIQPFQLLYGKVIGSLAPVIAYASGLVVLIAGVTRPPTVMLVSGGAWIVWLAVGVVAASIAAASRTKELDDDTVRRSPARVAFAGLGLQAAFLLTNLAAFYWVVFTTRDRLVLPAALQHGWVGIVLVSAVLVVAALIGAIAHRGVRSLTGAQR